MVNYYPLMLNLAGRRAVIVGGGSVAAQKIRTLVETAADITVVSPELHDEIKNELVKERIVWKKKRFEEKDICDAFLIIAATNKSEVNMKVYEAARAHQLIMLVDRPELSDFIVPATVRRGKLAVSVSTSGASPGLARKIKKELAEQYDETYEEYLFFLEETRCRVLREVSDHHLKRHILKELLQPLFLELTRQGKVQEREGLVQQLLKGETVR
ncbi:NAD(P)-binding protein [Bacillus thermotolerans]|uniref:precorrin-2 dehydrogenase n=1 Tax=Bacillus thermotolerans TaxID=1221996 RepID=A0A0F5I527_BACTR|nr:NAD(P)-binding protein [Bacillus thermotolerans]KKB40558.1 Siroheme synthase / Precorrin-2 oxidase [Bacillus thermotolerans]